MLEFRVLGGLNVVDGAHEVPIRGARQRRLLAVLLVHRNAVVSVDAIAEAVFSGRPTARAGTTLRSYVARLRRVLDPARSEAQVVTRAPGYQLQLPDDALDAACFEAALRRGRSLLERGDPTSAGAAFHEALARWRGDAYAEFDDEDWVRGEVQRLDELRLIACEGLADADLAAGRPAQAVSLLDGLVAEHPLHEAFRRRLMIALYRAGRQAEALRSYHAHREVMVAELGLDPSPELVRIEAQILAHDEALWRLE